MDPEKTLTFCLGVRLDMMTMTLKYADGTTEASTVAVTQKELDQLTVQKVAKQHEGSGSQPVVSPKYCPGVKNNPGYLCETGHCCGETGCCTYYYELWWFWLLWTVLILFSCFCAYRHRRAKLRIQQQQRQREINLIAYNGACNFPSSMLDLSFLATFKLPSYDEVAARPTTPPPPYSSVFALQGGAMLGPSSSYAHHHLHSHPCPPYLGPGSSGLASSQSSDNYTSCSCESCSLTSPCSTSFSVQVTDETYDSSRLSTPSEAGGDGALLPRAGGNRLSTSSSSTPSSQVPLDVVPALSPDVVPSHSYHGNEGISRPAAPVSLPMQPYNSSRPSHLPRLPLSPLNLLSSLPSNHVHHFVYSDPMCATPKEREEDASRRAVLTTSLSTVMRLEDEDEEDDEEDHFRHRRLTGDSGIEVCRPAGRLRPAARRRRCHRGGLGRLTSRGTFPRDDKQEEAERPYADDDDDELNEVEANGNWTPQEKALHEARLKAKAKRRLRKSSSRNSTSDSLSESGETAGADPSSPKGKVPASDRKSRTGKGRGLPKKGGAGGKGVWGAAGMVYEDEEPDLQDPNYDESAQGDTVYAKVVPELDKRDLGKMVNPIVQEYFEHGDTKEVQMLGQFIARAIADHVLPMSFLDCYKGKVDCDHARVALDRAAVLLSIKGAMVRLDNVWGVGGGLRPVKHLIKEMNLLLKEYLTSGDVLEAERCLRELEVPHFHHELVYEAVVMVLESKGDSASPMIIKLLQSLWKTGHLTVDQMNRGFQRVYDELPEINLDVPHAHTIMETFVDLCYQESVISKQLRDACPSRGRKRMVSEGDGGKIKN